MKKTILKALCVLLTMVSLAGCGESRYYSDKEVDRYITKRIPGCEFVAKENSADEEINAIYTYKDKQGRDFHVISGFNYAGGLANEDITWMTSKKLYYTYEMDVLAAEQENVKKYLDQNWPDYEFKYEKYNASLYLYIDTRDEDTLMEAAEVCNYISENILNMTSYKAMDEKVKANNWGEANIIICERDSAEFSRENPRFSYSICPIDKESSKEIFEGMIEYRDRTIGED